MLEKLFKEELEFDVKTHKNLNLEESKKVIATIARCRGAKAIACVVLVISSHGGKGGALKTRDGEDIFRDRDVIDELSQSQALKNVPKIVIGKSIIVMLLCILSCLLNVCSPGMSWNQRG